MVPSIDGIYNLRLIVHSGKINQDLIFSSHADKLPFSKTRRLQTIKPTHANIYFVDIQTRVKYSRTLSQINFEFVKPLVVTYYDKGSEVVSIIKSFSVLNTQNLIRYFNEIYQQADMRDQIYINSADSYISRDSILNTASTKTSYVPILERNMLIPKLWKLAKVFRMPIDVQLSDLILKNTQIIDKNFKHNLIYKNINSINYDNSTIKLDPKLEMSISPDTYINFIDQVGRNNILHAMSYDDYSTMTIVSELKKLHQIKAKLDSFNQTHVSLNSDTNSLADKPQSNVIQFKPKACTEILE